jgi:hypothetical protein
MLHQIKDVGQIKGEPHCRWFTDEHFALVIWDEIVGFQLCYDKSRSERAITWKAGSGFSHNAVDGGEDRAARYKGSPILVADGVVDAKSSDFIYLKLLEYPQK